MMEEWDAIFWDIGGVLLDLESVETAHRAFLETVLDEDATTITTDEAVETWQQILGDYFRERKGTTFRPAREGYARALEAILEERPPTEKWYSTFHAVVSRHAQPVPGAVETIRTLADQDVHVGVISDIDDERGRRLLEQFDIYSRLDSVTTSETIGRTKPDPAMFEAALEVADAAPHRSIMVGDRYSHDMAGAADLGIVTVAHKADDGPSVDHRIQRPPEVLELFEID